MAADEFHDSDLGRYRLAVDRSHKDAQVSNEHSRATAQALILINGGAATAVLAYLAKDELDPNVLTFVSLGLVGYCIGVCLGVAMLYCMMRSLDYFAYFWRVTARPDGSDPEKHRKKAHVWLRWTDACFFGAAIFFLYSTTIVAWTLGS
jgi:hypothetical protein